MFLGALVRFCVFFCDFSLVFIDIAYWLVVFFWNFEGSFLGDF